MHMLGGVGGDGESVYLCVFVDGEAAGKMTFLKTASKTGSQEQQGINSWDCLSQNAVMGWD